MKKKQAENDDRLFSSRKSQLIFGTLCFYVATYRCMQQQQQHQQHDDALR